MAENDVTRLIEPIRAVLSPHAEVLFAYLFGSAAKGSLRTESDVDIAVFFSEAEGEDGRLDRAERTLTLEGEVERALGRRAQLVSLNDVPLGLAHNILRSGRLILSSDDAARRRFFVAHARRYFDMEHARRIFDRYRSRRIEEGTFGGRERHGS